MKDTSYYQHFIGGIYEKLNEAIHSETGEAFVVYQSVDGEQVWVRPSAMFNEKVILAGYEIPRFRPIQSTQELLELMRARREEQQPKRWRWNRNWQK
jgi:hypothetical protein